ncbi:hypothetical protein CUMW_223620 [Citrus unshiu]|uniref:Disease resistance N-terminal domain-containing protein n=1 Tax=Citrus unshiu TaxID=55188 RepID=A0A2H5QF27_CITUN|nr:hypothetical protein CUMW_223620 [Citrus unshiu]
MAFKDYLLSINFSPVNLEESVRLWLDRLKYASYDIEDVLDEWITARAKLKLTKELCDVIEDYSLDKESVAKLVKLIDKSNGYIFAGMDASAVEFSKVAIRDILYPHFSHLKDKFCLTKKSTVAEVQEKYIKDDDDVN